MLDTNDDLWYHKGMGDHRIRLDDEEVLLVVGALLSRAAGVSDERRKRILKLASRLAEGVRGNPNWILGDDVPPRKDPVRNRKPRT